MITKDDWNAALDTWVAAERERLGGPPAPAEIVAYVRGELPAEDAERVQELLVYYPDLTPLLSKKVRRRPAVLRYLPIAATVAFVLCVVPWHRPEPSFAIEPKHELHAVQLRGRGPVPPPFELPADEDRYVLSVFLSEPPHDPAYRVEIVEAAGGDPVWRSPDIQTDDDGAIELHVLSRGFRGGGIYRIDIYGVDAAGSHLRDSYPVRATKK